MDIVTISMTGDTAEAVLLALKEHLYIRCPVREYVDKRYAHMDDAFRNRKIGEVQERIDHLHTFIRHTQNKINNQGESMKTRNQNRGYEIAARLMDNYEGKQDMDSNTWNDLVVRVGDAINQAKVGAGIRRIAEAEGVIETEETE